MANTKDMKPISAFAIAFANEYKSYMKAHKVRQVAIANALQVTEAYVSERVNGKRALDTDDVDALAKLTGTTGKNLMIELARLAQRIMDAKIDGGFALAASDDPNKRIEAETPDE